MLPLPSGKWIVLAGILHGCVPRTRAEPEAVEAGKPPQAEATPGTVRVDAAGAVRPAERRLLKKRNDVGD